MSRLKHIECTPCKTVFEKMEVLNFHMKSVHQESDSDRIERLALTIGSALAQESNILKTSQDCTECGTEFSTIQEKKDHEKNHHTNGVSLNESPIESTKNKTENISTKTLWSEDQTKLYKVTTFPNSDGEDFGLTIKGKGKHLEAHNKVMDTINRLPKDKATTFGNFKLTVNDKVKTSSLLNANVTITTLENVEGNAEIKIYKPSDKRHKATIEIRKLTGYNYDSVEMVEDLVTTMLDNFTAGESVSRVLLKAKSKAKPYSPTVKQPSLSTKMFSCTECDFKSKTLVPLKNHMTKNHKSVKSRCELCGFQATDNDVAAHIKEFHLVHNTIAAQNKEKRKKSVIGCDQCGVTVDNKNKLRRHKESQHPVCEESSSSSKKSPPRKKPLTVVEVKNVNEAEVNMLDLMELDTPDENKDHLDSLAKEEIIKNQAIIINNQAKAIKRLEENVESLAKSKNENKTPKVEVSSKKKIYLNILAQ